MTLHFDFLQQESINCKEKKIGKRLHESVNDNRSRQGRLYGLNKTNCHAYCILHSPYKDPKYLNFPYTGEDGRGTCASYVRVLSGLCTLDTVQCTFRFMYTRYCTVHFQVYVHWRGRTHANLLLRPGYHRDRPRRRLQAATKTTKKRKTKLWRRKKWASRDLSSTLEKVFFSIKRFFDFENISLARFKLNIGNLFFQKQRLFSLVAGQIKTA